MIAVGGNPVVEISTYEVAYPDIVHPLIDEKFQVKEKYILLLEHFVNLFADVNIKKSSSYRLDTLSKILLGTSIVNLVETDNSVGGEVVSGAGKFKSPIFKLTSYRHLFLFDSLFILGIDNEKIGNCICEEILKLTNVRFHKSLKEMTRKMYSDDYMLIERKTITPEMLKSWKDARNYLTSNKRKITFTATMSAGKSTLINALIGQTLSFSKKSACTSTVLKFLTSPCKTQEFCVVDNDDVSFLSAQEVRAFTNSLTKPCEIMGYFDSILSTQRVEVIDTPGVNSSLNPEHKKITREELRNGTDILVYVIPVEYYGSEDDYNHLVYIKKNVSYNNILFAINMMDSCDLEDDSIDEIVCQVKNHLSEIGFENPCVCPLSAKAGGLLKKAVMGIGLSDNDKAECKVFKSKFNDEELQLEKYYPSFNLKKDNRVDDLLWKAFVSTGLPGFEALLYQYVREE